MAVKIRLKRMGKKKQPTYRVVVADGRSPRDGRFIEAIGRYDPRQEPSVVEIDNDKALDWLRKGAQPTDPVRKLLEISGAWSRFKVAKGEIHTVGDQPAPSQTEVPPVAETVETVEVTDPAGETAETEESSA
jgi:small subunit ribosomal protein S16